MDGDDMMQKRLLLTKEEENDEIKRQKLIPFSDLSEHQLTELLGEALRFELCSTFLIYDHILENHKLFGTIRATTTANRSPDPLNAFSDVFNREFNNPVHVTMVGWQYLYDMRHCSLPVSSTSTVQIAAKLYVTTDEVDDVEIYPEEDHQRKACKYLDDHEAFQVCDGHASINFLDKPNGGWGRRNIMKGRDGSLELCYVALKYAVDAGLEVEFDPPPEKINVTGRVRAYYGKNFDYEFPPDDFYVVLSETSSPDFVEAGKINLIRSVLSVPAQYSLIFEAEFCDDTSGAVILSGTCEFSVPRDGHSSIGSIAGTDCSLKLKVNWKLPFEKAKFPSSPVCSLAPFSSNSSVDRLTERRKSGAHTTSSMADSDDDDGRWSLQDEIEKVFNTSLERTFDLKEEGPCSISTCKKEDDGDYLCTSVLHIWPQLRDTYYGPKHAGLELKDYIMGSEYKDMMERCVVCGPGFVKFKLSRTWIAKSIQQMLTNGIDTWAPKLSLEKAILYFPSQNITDEMHMAHVTDVGQQDYNGMCISAAKRAGWLTEDHSKYLLGHVGSGLAEFDDFNLFRALSTKVDNLVGLLDEAKGCCKALLAGQAGMADGWTAEGLDHAAEALRYGVVKYAGLKNNRLANYAFPFDQMFNREGYTALYILFTHARICLFMRDFSEEIKKVKAEELVLKDDDERELGLHLLRFTEVFGEVCTSIGPHILCKYLFVLCVKFNNLNVGQDGASSEETRRLSLCEATEVVVRKCFDLLGIAPISRISSLILPFLDVKSDRLCEVTAEIMV